MILNFTNVKVKNFMSFEQASVDLSSNQGFISITGENNNKEDLAISNGENLQFGKRLFGVLQAAQLEGTSVY